MNNRRNFLKQSLATVGVSLLGSQLVQAESFVAKSPKIDVKQNDIILFQGDSITDNGRKKDSALANNTDAMGKGYAMIAGSMLLNKYASKNITIYNRGISGNKVPQLDARWQADCLDLKPSILSILIGINDYWHKKNGKYEGSAELYRDQYRALLDKTLKEFPNLRLIIGEPFVVKNVKYVDDTWFPEVTKYQEVARNIAKEYKAILIPYQSIFDNAEKKAPGSYWTTDGIHTSLAGANLMAEAWMNCIK